MKKKDLTTTYLMEKGFIPHYYEDELGKFTNRYSYEEMVDIIKASKTIKLDYSFGCMNIIADGKSLGYREATEDEKQAGWKNDLKKWDNYFEKEKAKRGRKRRRF